MSLFAYDAVAGELAAGVWTQTPPDPKTFRGSVIGDPLSEVRLTIVGSASKGFIRLSDETYHVEPAADYGASVSPEAVMIFPEAAGHSSQRFSLDHDTLEVPRGAVTDETGPGYEVTPPAETNGTSTHAFGMARSPEATPPVIPMHSTVPAHYYARVFLASDDQFRTKYPDWKGEQQARLNYVDAIFANQFQVHFRIAGQFALSSSSLPGPYLCDPGQGSSDVLLQFRNLVQASPTFGPNVIARDLSVLMSGRDLTNPSGGRTYGCAYQTVLSSSYAYLVTSFDALFLSSSSLILAHEMGHNFGGWHGNEPSPPRPATAGPHWRYTGFPCSFKYSIMISPFIEFCIDEWFSDGTIFAEYNNKASMLSVIQYSLRRLGTNFLPIITTETYSSSGTLWGHGPERVGDASFGTYWWAPTEVSWLQITLPAPQYLWRTEIHGYTGYYLASFSLKISPDGSTWTTVFTGGSTSSVDFNIRYKAMWTRYVRLEVNDIYQCCGALNGYAVIREIELFETANVASWRPGSSSGDLWGHLPFEAVDGNWGTYWWGTSSSGSWIRYDFPATCVHSFRLQLYSGYGVFQMQVHAYRPGFESTTSYTWGSQQIDLFLPTPISGCDIYAFRITFLDNGHGGINDYPVVRELEVYYGE